MGKRILLVEGKDDQHVMWNLFEVRAVRQGFEVKCPGSKDGTNHERDEARGVEALLESIPARLLEADLECLAVIVDADDKGPRARWASIRDRLASAGYAGIPDGHGEQGVVFELSLRPQTPRSVRFGAWIMPDNRREGMLEDFVAMLIPNSDGMLPLVDRFLGSIPDAERRFTQAHLPKARVHSWLAVSERPGRPMGQAIRSNRYIDARHPSVQPFLDWIERALLE